MPVFEQGALRINYEVHGNGFPLLLLAPGGMRSTIGAWERAPWDPRTELADRFQVIAMDQRNAGASSGPIGAEDGWATYTGDQLALLDHLGIDRCHVLGMCIGGPYCMGLIERAPARIAAAVLLQTIGSSTDNRAAFTQLFDGWADALKPQRPEVPAEAWESFREHMFGGEFLYNVTREFVRNCTHPLLVMMGNDLYHPEATSREIAELAPHATLVEHWKEPEHRANGIAKVREFLQEHTPGGR
jgi:pimeloyl-ACP methyl ester carboxylesterase